MAKRQSQDARTEEASTPDASPHQNIPINPNEVLFSGTGVPEVLIDGMVGASIVNGIVRLNCFSVQQLTATEQKPAVILRLAMSLSTFVSLQQALTNMLAEFEKNAVISRST
jgi:hypothetical protein